MLVLAGPRRHYLIWQCRDRAIPYVYVGDETYIDAMKDDFSSRANIVDEAKMAVLYTWQTHILLFRVPRGGQMPCRSPRYARLQLCPRGWHGPHLLATWCLFDSVGEAAY